MLLPAGRIRPAGAPGSAATLNAVANALQLFAGVVGTALPSAPVPAGGGDLTAGAARVARGRGARYAAVLAGVGEGGADLIVNVVDARDERRIASLRVPAGDASAAGAAASDVVVGILRAIAPRDSAFPAAYRSVLRASGSSQAVIRLVEGQQRFAMGDLEAAREAYRRALAADTSCLLASYRLSALEAWEWRFAAAHDIADAGLRRAAGRDDAWARLLRAQRLLTMRHADSAIAAFGRTVADDPHNVDGWYGLSQALYYFGWVNGDSVASARPVLDRVLRLDSAFAPVHGQLVDASLAAGDTAAARAALAGIDAALDWRRAKELLVRYASAPAGRRDAVLRSFGGEAEFTYSELVLQLARTLRDPAAADRVAALMQSPRLAPAARRRAAQYRLALAAAGRREADQLPAVLEGGAGFDAWVGAAVLAGRMPGRRAAVRAAARRAVPPRVAPEDLDDPSAAPTQALEFLVQDALDDASGARARDVGRLIRSVQPPAHAAAHAAAHPASAVGSGWRASLDARLALTRGDTAEALRLLRLATGRVAEPYGAFVPLVSYPAQRRLLLALLRTRPALAAEARVVESSFRRSWAIADALFAGR